MIVQVQMRPPQEQPELIKWTDEGTILISDPKELEVRAARARRGSRAPTPRRKSCRYTSATSTTRRSSASSTTRARRVLRAPRSEFRRRAPPPRSLVSTSSRARARKILSTCASRGSSSRTWTSSSCSSCGPFSNIVVPGAPGVDHDESRDQAARRPRRLVA